jgi:hypothetical protein
MHHEQPSTADETDGNDRFNVYRYKPANIAESSDDEIMETQSSGDEESAEGSDSEEEDESSDDDETSSELEDNPTYQDWFEGAKESTRDMWREKYDKYINGGMSERFAREKANIKTLWAVKKHFFDTYKDFLSSYLRVKDNDTHQEILLDLESKIEAGVDVNKALSRVLSKHQSTFDGLFQHDEESDEEESEEDTEEDEEEDMEDDEEEEDV